MSITSHKPGKIIIYGSGETSEVGTEILRKFFLSFDSKQSVSILETPAGFQPNSEQVARDIADTYKRSLNEFINGVTVIPARAKNTELSPDNIAILEPLHNTDFIFLGPGSPTYAVKHLNNTKALDILISQWGKGSTLAFSSAAAMAIGKYTLPVYEIYKAGSELFWVDGLNILERIGLNVTVIAHWNNNDGGDSHDTSRCFMGQERFARLVSLLPKQSSILGIDENTAMIIDPQSHSFTVVGRGAVTLTNGNSTTEFKSENYYSIKSFQNGVKENGTMFLTPKKIVSRRQPISEIPDDIQKLLHKRQLARDNKDFRTSDLIREELYKKGYDIEDSNTGVEVYLRRS